MVRILLLYAADNELIVVYILYLWDMVLPAPAKNEIAWPDDIQPRQ